MYQRGVYRYGEGKGVVRQESRGVEEIKRNFGEGELLLINRGQTHIPHTVLILGKSRNSELETFPIVPRLNSGDFP